MCKLPTCPLARLGGALARAIYFLGSTWLFSGGAQVKALSERVADLVGIGGSVRGVDEKHIPSLAADASNVAIGHLRLDHMTQHAIPAGQFKIAFEGRGTDVDRSFNIGAVDRIVAD